MISTPIDCLQNRRLRLFFLTKGEFFPAIELDGDTRRFPFSSLIARSRLLFDAVLASEYSVNGLCGGVKNAGAFGRLRYAVAVNVDKRYKLEPFDVRYNPVAFCHLPFDFNNSN